MANSRSSDSEALRVADQLRADILDGHRPPGDKLVERTIAEEFGVSRIPVRDALKALVVAGLVTPRPRTWAVVREFSGKEIADFNEFRAAFETLAFRLAAQRRTPEGMLRLQETLEREFAAARAGDQVGARHAAADFHEAVIEVSGNQMLQEVARSTRSRMRWFLSQHDNLEEVAQQHSALCQAIAQGDIGAVDELLEAHFEFSARQHQAHAGTPC